MSKHYSRETVDLFSQWIDFEISGLRIKSPDFFQSNALTEISKNLSSLSEDRQLEACKVLKELIYREFCELLPTPRTDFPSYALSDKSIEEICSMLNECRKSGHYSPVFCLSHPTAWTEYFNAIASCLLQFERGPIFLAASEKSDELGIHNLLPEPQAAQNQWSRDEVLRGTEPHKF